MTYVIAPRPAGAARLILVRHGEPDAAVRGRCYGRLDVGLSPCGREQMKRTRAFLREATIEAAWSSPARRAMESLALLAGDRPAPTVDERLCEIDFGRFEGCTYEEIAARHPTMFEAWMTRPTAVAFPDGESFASVSARVLPALDAARAATPDGTTLVVSHASINRIALAAVLGLDADRVFTIDQAYASVNVIDYVSGRGIVRLVNAVAAGPC